MFVDESRKRRRHGFLRILLLEGLKSPFRGWHKAGLTVDSVCIYTVNSPNSDVPLPFPYNAL